MIKSLINNLIETKSSDAVLAVSRTIEQLTKAAQYTGRLNSTKVDDAFQAALGSLEQLEEVILNEVV